MCMFALSLVVFGLSSVAVGLDLPSVVTEAQQLQLELVELRRAFHQKPELMFEERETSRMIRDQLDRWQIPYKYPYAKTGLVGTIGQGSPVVALRADIDALPIVEEGDVPYKSQRPGVMHACGHDAHMTMLLGAAKLLKAQEKSLRGTVKLVFQPAEEGGAGADIMIKEGALEDVEAAFGMHVMPHIPTGTIGYRAGTIMAGAMSFEITVHGRGGHAALPHLNVDPIPAAAAVVSALQTLVSRETSPLGSAVVSVTMLKAGETYNVIPDEALVAGTVRTLTHDHMVKLTSRLEALSSRVAEGYGCSVEVNWREDIQPYYPPTINDVSATSLAQEVLSTMWGPERVQVTEPLMAGEDFSFITQKVPASFLFLGIRNETAGAVHNLHSPRFTLDESVLSQGAATHAALALAYLEKNQATIRDEL